MKGSFNQDDEKFEIEVTVYWERTANNQEMLSKVTVFCSSLNLSKVVSTLFRFVNFFQ
jgi:hypothetical protein